MKAPGFAGGWLLHQVVFRGQPAKGNLLPSVARTKPSANSTKIERKVLAQLKLQGASMIDKAGPTNLDRMVMAQYFGLKTSLLDWTSNPLVALWFACADREPGDVYVYALEADDLIENKLYEKDPFATRETRVFQPRLNNPRIIAQQGWFTLHKFSTQSKRFVALEKNAKTKSRLHEFCIAEKLRETC